MLYSAVDSAGGQSIQLLTEDTQAGGVTSAFGQMALTRWQDSNGIAESFVNGVVDGAGLRDQSYNSTQRLAAEDSARERNRNMAFIAISLLLGIGLAIGLKEGA